tara:strand:- start:17 stop:445 length:429 start_codon:yes stop_codon:yes gene_type:complete
MFDSDKVFMEKSQEKDIPLKDYKEREYSPIDYNLYFFNEKFNDQINGQINGNLNDDSEYKKMNEFRSISFNNEFYLPFLDRKYKINLYGNNIKKDPFDYPQELLNEFSYNEMYEEFMENEKELNEMDDINYNDDIMIKNLDY